jgi:protein-S-isoprenylcysteine O-methyltransferase Ste14
MNKKINTLLFILGATVANILIFVIVFFVLLFLYLQFLASHVGPEVSQWATALIFVITIALSFIIYNRFIKVFTNKIDMDKYFDPLVKPRRRK